MANENLRTVDELVDAAGPIDTVPTFEALWGLVGELRARIDERFTLMRDPSSIPYDVYESAPGVPGPRGHMTTWVGQEVDWMVQSNIGNPAFGFSNMHLTLWLGPHVKVPHLAFAFGTMPDLFFLVDYMPRSDLRLDIDALRAYYEPVNAKWLAFRETPGLKVFTSRALYIRQVLSENAFCGLLDRTTENVALVSALAHDELTRWLGWLDEATATPEAEQAALAAYDLQIRRNSAELDPANVMAVRYFGQDMMQALLRQLWGGDRTLARPGGLSNETSLATQPLGLGH
jgi:Red chlorophyll catabolite reductase (RCC reductase)